MQEHSYRTYFLQWRRGSGLDYGSGFDSRHTLTRCGALDARRIKTSLDVPVPVLGYARLKTPSSL